MKQFLFLILGLIALSGCGSDFYVANHLNFGVSFNNQQVQVSFNIKPDYAFKYNERLRFDRLGIVAVKWNEITKASEIGVLLNASPDILGQDWPVKEIIKFPNDRKFPASVRTPLILEWKQNGSPLNGSVLYQKLPELIAGGSFVGGDFKDLPRNFFGTQKFREKNGSLQATLSILGPSDNFEGGVFFFGNFGKNPFTKSATDEQVNIEQQANQSGMILANEPFKVFNYGENAAETFSILREKFSSDCPGLQCPSLSGIFSPQSGSAL